MQHAYKSKNEQNKNWSLKSDIVYGNIDFPLMARPWFYDSIRYERCV